MLWIIIWVGISEFSRFQVSGFNSLPSTEMLIGCVWEWKIKMKSVVREKKESVEFSKIGVYLVICIIGFGNKE